MFNNNNDLFFTFFIFDGDDSDAVTSSASQVISAVLAPAIYNIPFASSANSKVTYKTRLYQLAFGHRIYFDKKVFMIHPFLGVGYATVFLNQQTAYLGLGGTQFQASVNEKSCFKGIGPLLGFDIDWHIWRYFSVVGSVLWNAVIANINESFQANSNLPMTGFPFAVSGKSSASIINLLSFEAGLAAHFKLIDMFYVLFWVIVLSILLMALEQPVSRISWAQRLL